MTITIPDDLSQDARTGYTILAFVAQHPGTYGRVRAARILTGDANEDDIERGLAFDPGDTLDVDRITALRIIDAYIEDGQIAKTYGDRPRLCLTQRGYRILETIDGPEPITGKPLVEQERTMPNGLHKVLVSDGGNWGEPVRCHACDGCGFQHIYDPMLSRAACIECSGSGILHQQWHRAWQECAALKTADEVPF